MDQNSPIVTDELRKMVFDKLADSYIEEVGSGRLTPVMRQSISEWILKSVRTAGTEEELIAFLDALSKQHPFFKASAMNLKSEMALKKERELIGKLQQYYQKLKI